MSKQQLSVKKAVSAWDLPIQYIKGVGEKLASAYSKADIRTLWELLLFLPKSYEDRRKALSFDELQSLVGQNKVCAVKGEIYRYVQHGLAKRRGWLEAILILEGSNSLGRVLLTFFHNAGAHVEKRFPVGSRVICLGKVQDYRGSIQMVHPEILSEGDLGRSPDFGCIVPVYPEVAGISSRVTRRIMAQALGRPEVDNLPEGLPSSLCSRLNLPALAQSLREIHFPKTLSPESMPLEPSGPYFQRIVFEELFMMSLALHLRRAEWKKSELSASEIPVFLPDTALGSIVMKKYLAGLPFELTDGQRVVIGEVFEDTCGNHVEVPMHRLLQGDVGSGKTIVAFFAALAAMESSYQVALMAPTEILADQHYQNFCKLFPEKASQVLLLKGSLTPSQKKKHRLQIQDGQVGLVIGTQALLTEDTHFHRLGLVVVDEQHRFGVEQRLSLKHGCDSTGKKLAPHLLVMTATPIPRSLALTLYGDLNLSVLREKPKGRQPIKTFLVKQRAHEKLAARLGEFLREGRQIYIVYPLIEESEELDLKDAIAAHKDWQSKFPEYQIELLHGKMKPKDKAEVFQRFKKGESRMLVSTTVIEVGVDVPNATVMVIEHAERFGLSQLHQLRGRVGRGDQESLCILVGPDYPGPLSLERLKTMEISDDGFFIAEKDLGLRGPGEFLGRKQSGMPGFRVAHVLRDVQTLELARDAALELLKKDPGLNLPEHRNLKTMLSRWWGGKLELTLSG